MCWCCIEFRFVVENFEDFVKVEEKDEIRIDAALAATLLAMAYSTARGIVFERTRGTFFDGVILPVIDPFNTLFTEVLRIFGKMCKEYPAKFR
jgi:hypothetical protein